MAPRENVDYLYENAQWSSLPVLLLIFLIIAVVTIIFTIQRQDKHANNNVNNIKNTDNTVHTTVENTAHNVSQHVDNKLSVAGKAFFFLLGVGIVLFGIGFVQNAYANAAFEQSELQEILQQNLLTNYYIEAAEVHVHDGETTQQSENTATTYRADIVLEDTYNVLETTVYYNSVKNLVFIPTELREEHAIEVRPNSRLANFEAEEA